MNRKIDNLTLTGPPSSALERLLDEGSAFVPPSRVFGDLRAEVACRRIAGAPHTIAEIVAHMRFWQAYTLGLARGEQPSVPVHAAEGWPSTDEGKWDTLCRAVVDGLTETRRLVREADLSLLVREHETLGYELTLHVLHNAVHVGQIMLLRRMLGAWPPPGGGETW